MTAQGKNTIPHGLTIEKIFIDSDIDLSSDLKARFAANYMRVDSSKALLNLTRMINSSQKEKTVSLLQSKVFVDEPASDVMISTVVSFLEQYE